MATALTGSLGWTGLHPMQLGGPPLINTYAKTIPAAAAPLIAHLYQNDGVTFLGSFSVLNLPPLVAVTANGGFEQIQLEVASRSVTVTQGNVIRLTFQGGDGSIVYSGIVEDLPDIATPTKTTHIILLSAFGFDLDDVHSTSVYTLTVDIAQIVRDAVAQTNHCSCDQVSVPAYTGIVAPLSTGGAVDFRDQTVKQQIDTCRSIAGPTWYWHVDELGRVWFQYMGSAATYTLMRGPHYEERTSAASIQDRKNRVRAVGGIPTGGTANVTAIYNGSSQNPGPTSIGVRALAPPLAVPNITDQGTLTAIVTTIGGVLDRVWNRVQLKIHRPYAQRIHGSQPGGGMLRYWEPAISPFPESSAGSGTYSGAYIAQRVEYDGLHQSITAGDIPVTSQNDVSNMVTSIVSQVAARSVIVTAAALNLPQQVVTGTFVSGTTTITTPSTSAQPATLWSLDQSMFQAVDPNGVARAQMGNLPANGISVAQWGLRVNDPSGVPIFDGLGLTQVMTQPSPAIHPGSNATWSTAGTVPISGSGFTPSSITFTLVRTTTMLFLGQVCAKCLTAGQTWLAGLSVDNSAAIDAESSLPLFASDFSSSPLYLSKTLAAGSHTVYLMSQPTPAGGVYAFSGDLFAFQLGG